MILLQQIIKIENSNLQNLRFCRQIDVPTILTLHLLVCYSQKIAVDSKIVRLAKQYYEAELQSYHKVSLMQPENIVKERLQYHIDFLQKPIAQLLQTKISETLRKLEDYDKQEEEKIKEGKKSNIPLFSVFEVVKNG